MDLQALLIFFITIVVFCGVLNYLLLKWTKTLGRKNDINDEEVRWSEDYKPAIGGVGFYIAFIIALMVYFALFKPYLSQAQELAEYGIVLCVTLGFFAGLADDAFNTVPWFKFIAQFCCGLILVIFGLQISFFDVAWLDALLTIFWTISVMNSINMLDNMDGITASVGISILLCAAICALPFSEANVFYTLICGGTVASLIGFLFLNWNPAKMFMGDTGSQMLGAMLAAVGIAFFWNNDAIITDHSWYSKLVIVMTAFVIPIGDSLTVTINRLRRGQSPFVGGRDHTTHHLSYAGLTDRQVAYVMIGLSAISVLLIAGLQYIPKPNLSLYVTILFIYCILAIGFLFSTPRWRKAKSRYQTLNSPTG